MAAGCCSCTPANVGYVERSALPVSGAKLYRVAKGTLRHWLSQLTAPRGMEQAPSALGRLELLTPQR